MVVTEKFSFFFGPLVDPFFDVLVWRSRGFNSETSAKLHSHQRGEQDDTTTSDHRPSLASIAHPDMFASRPRVQCTGTGKPNESQSTYHFP